MRKSVVNLCVVLGCVSTTDVVLADPPVPTTKEEPAKKEEPVKPTAAHSSGTKSEPAKTGTKREAPKTCTYSTYSWHVKKRRAVRHKRVEKPYGEVTDAERDPMGSECTVCKEDQIEVKVKGIPSVTVCWVFETKVRKALKQIRVGKEFRIEQIEGYRVGKTRGPVARGVRTVFSNHSYGTAIDINRNDNGLYNPCKVSAETLVSDPKRIKRCRRRVGGRWDPDKNPKTTITMAEKSPGFHVYKAFNSFWSWGGELEGRLKDFMHFSLDGK